MNRVIQVAGLIVVLGLGMASVGRAETPAERRDRELLKEVGDRLLAVCDPVPGFAWPPDIGIDLEDKGINAYATFILQDGKMQPIVRVTQPILKLVVQRDADRLALIVGHELGHILHKHVVPNEKRTRTPFLKNTFTREEETEADLKGTELMVKAGFSFRKGLRFIERMKDLKLEYTSFEGLGKDHPSWDDRLASIDKDQTKLWKSMSAFSNGVLFLTTEQYPQAIACFEQVTTDFPTCYEAWSNLGFARLMLYCDKLDKKDIETFGIGPIITGGFFLRPDSIKVREKDTVLWGKAVEALLTADRLKPGLTLVKANLGLAYLVQPEGKNVSKATSLLQEAAKAAPTDKTLDPVAHAALLMNLGVAHFADGKAEKGSATQAEAEKIVRKLEGERGKGRVNQTFEGALIYSRAQHLADQKTPDSRTEALALFKKYLQTNSPDSLWWPLAYERYAALCKALDQKPEAEETFKKGSPARLRLVTTVKLKSGAEINLGEARTAAVKKLGKVRETGVVSGTSLRRLHLDEEGVSVLVTDKVVAICLTGAESPALPLKGSGPGAGSVGQLKLGMTTREVENLLGDDYQPCELTVTEVYYRYYRAQGVAVRLVRGKVVELVVVQMGAS